MVRCLQPRSSPLQALWTQSAFKATAADLLDTGWTIAQDSAPYVGAEAHSLRYRPSLLKKDGGGRVCAMAASQLLQGYEYARQGPASTSVSSCMSSKLRYSFLIRRGCVRMG